MRLERVKIKNFRKIAQCEVRDIPPQGLFTLVGPNESGKTTVAEAVFFCLYGRSLRHNCPVVEVIQWGKNQAEVSLTFDFKGKRFSLERWVDRLGNHGATLTNLETRETVTGPEEVSAFLSRQGLFGFEISKNILYINSTPHSLPERKGLLEEVTGVAALSRASQLLREEIKARERKFALLGEEILRKKENAEELQGAAEQLEQLSLEREKASQKLKKAEEHAGEVSRRLRALRRLSDRWQRRANRLKNEEGKVLDSISSHLQKIENLIGKEREEKLEESGEFSKVEEEAAQLRNLINRVEGFLQRKRSQEDQLKSKIEGIQVALTEKERELREKKKSKRKALLGCVLGVLLAVGSGLTLASLGPVSLQKGELTTVETGLLAAGAIGAALAGVFIGVFLNRRGSYRRAISDLYSQKEELESAKTQHDKIKRFWEKSRGGKELQFVLEALREEGGEIPEPLNLVRSLSEAISRLASLRREQLSRTESAHREAQESLRKLRSQYDRLDNECRERSLARKKLEELKLEIENLEKEKSRSESELEDHLLALDLLEGTTSWVRVRAAPLLGEVVRKLIGPLTGGAYREARLDSELDLEVFAPEKGDFLNPAELSSAAASAAELSVSLALASLLGRASDPEGVVLFLDDPFLHLDQERLCGAAEGVSSLPGLSQIFLFLTSLPEKMRCNFFWKVVNGALEVFETDHRPQAQTQLSSSPQLPESGEAQAK